MSKKNKRQLKKKGLFAGKPFLAAVGLLLVAAAGAALFFAFTGGDAPKRRLRQEPVVTNEMAVSVDVVDRDYEPRDLTVPLGATVTWKFEGDLPHNVVDDRGAFESPIYDKGDEWTLTLDEPGTYYYYCTLHHSMQGTLVVAD
jgi:plastocyanin